MYRSLFHGKTSRKNEIANSQRHATFTSDKRLGSPGRGVRRDQRKSETFRSQPRTSYRRRPGISLASRARSEGYVIPISSRLGGSVTSGGASLRSPSPSRDASHVRVALSFASASCSRAAVLRPSMSSCASAGEMSCRRQATKL